jgi:putative FmdB family regulatory protein
VGPIRHSHLAGLTRLSSHALHRLAAGPALCHHAAAVPTYDYQCRSCGNVTEVIHSMLEEGPSTCELCGGTLRRMLYPTGIIFKGSGFYRTDSRKSGSSSAGEGASTSKPEPSSSSATESGKPSKSETKSTD